MKVRELSRILDVLRFDQKVYINPSIGIESCTFADRDLIVDESVKYVEDKQLIIESEERMIEIFEKIKGIYDMRERMEFLKKNGLEYRKTT